MNEEIHDPALDALLEDWRVPVVRTDFTKQLVSELPVQDQPEVTQASKIISLPNLFGPGTVMGAAAAILLLLVLGLAHFSRVQLESDLVEQDSQSDEAVSELYRLIHLEGLASMDEVTPEEADAALLLFATGG